MVLREGDKGARDHWDLDSKKNSVVEVHHQWHQMSPSTLVISKEAVRAILRIPMLDGLVGFVFLTRTEYLIHEV